MERVQRNSARTDRIQTIRALRPQGEDFKIYHLHTLSACKSHTTHFLENSFPDVSLTYKNCMYLRCTT